MNLTKVILFFSLSIFGFSIYAQPFADSSFYLVNDLEYEKLGEIDKNLIDSLLKQYHQSETKELEIVNKIVEESWDDRVWPKYNQWILSKLELQKKNEKLDSTSLLLYANCLLNTGYYERLKGNIKEALHLYSLSFKEYELLNRKEGLAYCLNNMGVIYDSQGNLKKALECYHGSLKLQEEIDDKEGVANSLSNIGEVHRNQADVEKALEYFNKSLKIQIEIKNLRGEANVLVKIGDIYRNREEYIKALEFLNKSLVLNEAIQDNLGIAISLQEIGNCYRFMGKLPEALKNYKKALSIAIEQGDQEEMAKNHNNLSGLYLELDSIKNAEFHARESYKIAEMLGFTDVISTSALTLSSILENENKTDEALQLYKKHIQLRDSLHNVENKKMAIRSQMQSDYDRQKAIDDLEKEKEIALANEEKKRQYLISIFFAVVGGLVVVFLIIIFNRLKITREQKIVIEEANEELNQTNEEILAQRDQIDLQKMLIEDKHHQLESSIRYAKNIQQAILPKIENLNNDLPSHFIYFKPRDIVSGDFYWIDRKDEFLYIAAADCTGHGVPGAFMSMLGMSFLNQINRGETILSPNEILDLLRLNIIRELKQEGKDSDSKDGLDIALIRLNLTTLELEYAGAYNPLYIINKERNNFDYQKALPFKELDGGWEIKATKRPIGVAYGREELLFENHKVQLRKGDFLYFFSDGFPDQFGGEKESKYSYGRFKKLLLTLSENSNITEIENTIASEFENWKGNKPQTDDICVIGIKI